MFVKGVVKTTGQVLVFGFVAAMYAAFTRLRNDGCTSRHDTEVNKNPTLCEGPDHDYKKLFRHLV